MDTHIIKTFVDGLQSFLSGPADEAAIIETPFLESARNTPALDYSAVIGISGSFRGCVYLTAPTPMIQSLLKRVGEPADKPELLSDMVGEACNILAGNARAELGRDFMISPPFLFTGHPSEVLMPRDTECIVIPASWRGSRALLVVALRQQDPAK